MAWDVLSVVQDITHRPDTHGRRQVPTGAARVGLSRAPSTASARRQARPSSVQINLGEKQVNVVVRVVVE
jgi:hypothetical protein